MLWCTVQLKEEFHPWQAIRVWLKTTIEDSPLLLRHHYRQRLTGGRHFLRVFAR
jgi:hypothetical protein